MYAYRTSPALSLLYQPACIIYSSFIYVHVYVLVKCLALWGECERNSRHYSRPADYTPLGTAAMSQSAFEQSNAERNRLDLECCHSHLVASLPLLARAGIGIRMRCVRACVAKVSLSRGFYYLTTRIYAPMTFRGPETNAPKPANLLGQQNSNNVPLTSTR